MERTLLRFLNRLGLVYIQYDMTEYLRKRKQLGFCKGIPEMSWKWSKGR